MVSNLRSISITRRSRWKNLGAWLFGLLALSVLIIAVLHFGEIAQFAELARRAEPRWLLVAVILQAFTYLCEAVVWYCVLRQANYRHPLSRLTQLSIAKLFTEQAFPSGGVSGAVFMLKALERYHIPAQITMTALVIEMLSYYLAFFLMLVVSLGILWFHHGIQPAFLVVAAIFSLVIVIVVFIIVSIRIKGVFKLPRSILQLSGVKFLSQAFAGTRFDFLRDPVLILRLVTLHCLEFAFNAGTLWVVLLAIGSSVQRWIILPSFVMASIVGMLAPVPLEMGTFEGGMVGMFTLLGVPLATGLTAAILLRGFTFWLPMFPGLWLTRREMISGQMLIKV